MIESLFAHEFIDMWDDNLDTRRDEKEQKRLK
jgi:hypothetical protein